jgi:nucleoid-associated protein YgaU
VQIGAANAHRTAAAQPPTTTQQDTATTNSQRNTTTNTQQDSADTWSAMEPASRVQIGAANAHRTAAAQPPTTTQQDTATTKSQQDSTKSWRSTEPASKVQIGGADEQRTAAARPPTTSRQDTTTNSQQDTATTKSRQESDDSWRSMEPASELQVGGPLQGAKTPTTSGRPSVSGRMRVGVPDRPADGAPVRYTEVRGVGVVRVVVREGDSLWALAARELGAGATSEAIAARWPEWYAANRHVIGDDPNLILPGQVLRVPPAPTDHLPAASTGHLPPTSTGHIPPASTGHLPPTHQEP